MKRARARGSSSRNPVARPPLTFNTEKFISKEAKQKYEKMIEKNKMPILERGMFWGMISNEMGVYHRGLR